MHKLLIIRAFDRAKELREIKGEKSPSKTSMSEDISDYMEENKLFKLTGRQYKSYYDNALKKTNSEDDINIKQQRVIRNLCKYLGYSSYEDFLATENIIKLPDVGKSENGLSTKSKLIGSSIFAIIISYFSYDITKKDCMVWTENSYYKAISCEDKGELPSLKKDNYILENFKRINPDSTYTFFNIDGTENLWYERNSKGDLEFFTLYGKHPVTGETLKKITRHMIKKYIYESYED